jgi:signal transduction histidine kinase
VSAAEDDRPRAGGSRRGLARLGIGQLLALSIGTLLAIAVAGVVFALVAYGTVDDEQEELASRIVPAQAAAQALERALLNQETGVRGYLLTGERRFLDPYEAGLRDESRAYMDLAAFEQVGQAGVTALVREIRDRALVWRTSFVLPARAVVLSGGRASPAETLVGKRRFDRVRESLDDLGAQLESERVATREEFFDAARRLRVGLYVAAGLIIGSLVLAAIVLSRTVTQPLGALARGARRVASGGFETPLPPPGGPREVAQLGDDVEAMRGRIVGELQAADAARAEAQASAAELARSNADLEQFAYVASHDLQEPLRKVSSFADLLARRYRGQLDERGDGYIGFIVDGARRMQLLINDLLAFSRVGRAGGDSELIPASELVDQARTSLTTAIEEAGASVEAGELPPVRGQRALLVAVFQNLIGNAVKFRGADPPAVRIEARPDGAGGLWEFSCTDNGIGIDPEFADRIFVIFQRLHPRDHYDGSGIGLAMCRKIVEHHGGRIWLDTDHRGGARFLFTLPGPRSPR